MNIAKEIVEKIDRFTINRECKKTDIAKAIGCKPNYLNDSLKRGYISEKKYYRLLTYLENLDKKIIERKEREANLLKTPVA